MLNSLLLLEIHFFPLQWNSTLPGCSDRSSVPLPTMSLEQSNFSDVEETLCVESSSYLLVPCRTHFNVILGKFSEPFISSNNSTKVFPFC